MKKKDVSLQWLSDEEILSKWEKYCKNNGLCFEIPSLPFERTKKYAFLRNCRAEFARFNLRTQKFEI